MPKDNNWTKEETIVAFNVYCKIPFKSSSKTNPTVIEYAEILGRSPSALNMKIGNFGRLDPELKKQGIVGLTNGSKLEEEVWEEFNGNWEKLAFESELLLAKLQNKDIAEVISEEKELVPEGKEREAIVHTRVNQSFFRSAILASYNSTCCITGLIIPAFLVASHIVPWKKDVQNRLNPRNGLCLNSIHDRAFDQGFITVTPDYTVLVSKHFADYPQNKAIKDFFLNYDHAKIALPDKFFPAREFLDFHYREIFIK